MATRFLVLLLDDTYRTESDDDERGDARAPVRALPRPEEAKFGGLVVVEVQLAGGVWYRGRLVARTQPTWRQRVAAGSMSAVEKYCTFLSLSSKESCARGGLAGAFRRVSCSALDMKIEAQSSYGLLPSCDGEPPLVIEAFHPPSASCERPQARWAVVCVSND